MLSKVVEPGRRTERVEKVALDVCEVLEFVVEVQLGQRLSW